MVHFRLQFVLSLLLLLPTGVGAQSAGTENEPQVAALSFAQLAAEADFVGLVQVADTDYEYTRGFPSGGTAFLRVLIPYKVTRPMEDLLEVYEEGLHENECYFPNPSVFEEGRRFLVFLRISADVPKQYNGLDQGCALEVLVTAKNRYALRLPLDGMKLAGGQAEDAREMRFADTYAVLEEEAISPDRRNALLEQGWLERVGDAYRYTHGIPLERAREWIGAENLTLDRTLK